MREGGREEEEAWGEAGRRWLAGWLAGQLAGEAEVSPFTAPAHKSGDDRHFAYTGRAEVSPFAAPAHKNESHERRRRRFTAAG